MSDEKKITERDAVLRERAAARYMAGYFWDRNYFSIPMKPHENPMEEAEHRIADRYPLPKVTRPRVMPWHDWEYRRTERFGTETRRKGTEGWMDAGTFSSSAPPMFLRMLADLAERPTEEIEDDS